MEDDFRERRFYAVSYQDDIPTPGQGMLIPYQKKEVVARAANFRALQRYVAPTVLTVTGLLYVFTLSMIGSETYARFNLASLPVVSVVNPVTEEVKPLHYGVQIELGQPGFFAETRDAFVEAEVTFIEVDLAAAQLRYFTDGVLTITAPILGRGEAGSWWDTPSGLYTVDEKDAKYFSRVGQVYLPSSLIFEGNFFIHGWPYDENGEPVPEEYAGGGIRLSVTDAARLFEEVAPQTPVLVHSPKPKAETFLYEPKIPELETPHYLIADVESSTVLAASALDVVAPIASVTKLMTALVAAETINLDTAVTVKEPTFVQSLIPRLGERTKVSMYSLLQLLLVESSNEAAEVIAAQVGREEFIAKMNEKAQLLGLTHTHFADPSGLSAENVSSVGDLLRLTQYIYESRRFIFDITANQEMSTAYVSGEFGALVNFNQVADWTNLVGGKVGETIAAGQTSVTLHKIVVRGQERTLAIIILGSKERSRDVGALYGYALERFAR